MEKEIPEDANDACPGPSTESAGKSTKCEGCPYKSKCLSGTPLTDPSHP